MKNIVLFRLASILFRIGGFFHDLAGVCYDRAYHDHTITITSTVDITRDQP